MGSVILIYLFGFDNHWPILDTGMTFQLSGRPFSPSDYSLLWTPILVFVAEGVKIKFGAYYIRGVVISIRKSSVELS